MTEQSWTIDDVEFRIATMKDIDFLTKFNVDHAFEIEERVLNYQETHKVIKEIMEYPKLGEYFVCVLKWNPETPISCLMISYEFNILDNRNCCWFESVYVDADYRKKGVFKKMFNEIISLGKSRNYNKVKLYVENDNENAMATYERMGMYMLKGYCVYEIDSVFAFGNTIADVESRVANTNKYLAMLDEVMSEKDMKDKLFKKINNKSFEWIKIGDLSKEDLQKLNWVNLASVNEVEASQRLENYQGNGGVEYIQENRHLGDLWILKDFDNNEVIASFATFMEYSDWRGGNMYWVYDWRVHERWANDAEFKEVALNYYMREMSSEFLMEEGNLRVVKFLLDVENRKDCVDVVKKCKLLKAHYYCYQIDI